MQKILLWVIEDVKNFPAKGGGGLGCRLDPLTAKKNIFFIQQKYVEYS